MKAEGFLLDLDNTLYDYESAHQPASKGTFNFLAEKTGITFDTIKANYKTARERIHNQLHGQAASHSRLLYFQYLLEQLNLSPYELAVAAENYYWSLFFENMQLRPQCQSFLARLAPRPVIIITDLTASLQLRKIVHLGLQPYISAVVTSEEAGCEKPDKRIFELAISKSGLDATRLCMIGDNWDKDILGALRFDMPCLWLNTEDKSVDSREIPASVIEIKDFANLENLVHVYV